MPLTRKAQECVYLEIWCYRKGIKIQTNPLFLKGRDIFEYLDLCIFICSSKLVRTSTIRVMATLSLVTSQKPRFGSSNSGGDRPVTTASGTEVPSWPTTGGGGTRHSTSAQISEQEALSHYVDCSRISWEQHTSAEISGEGSYHTHVFSSLVAAWAPVCVTEALPPISQGLAFHPLLLLPSQPTICTLLHKFNF